MFLRTTPSLAFARPLTLLLLLFLAPVHGFSAAAAAPAAARRFDILAGAASATLKQFSRQAEAQVIFPAEQVHDIRTNPVAGDFTPAQALERMVAGTALSVVHDPTTGALGLRREPDPNAARATPAPAPGDRPNRLARSEASGVAGAAGAAGAGTSAIAGWVTNASTGHGLEGARIELPELGMSTLVDNTGHFMLTGVPAGAHEIVVTYTGLDTARERIDFAAGQRIARNFDLTTGGVQTLSAFTVVGEREGNAAAITAQRNADNVKNVVSMDAYGNLPNMNATELALRLPGVAGIPGDEVVEGVVIRGMGLGLNTITVDGGLMSSNNALSRQTRMTAFTGAMFEQLELIKGHTPDKSADSLGGTINFKTRSPLSMKEKRRITYNLSARYAPPFTEQIPLREQHRIHPLLNAAYQEVFSIAGEERNLGVAVNLFYSENVFGNFRATRDFENTLNSPAYLWDYRTEDNFNNRKQASINTKFDYRLSPNTKITVNLIYNDAFEPARRRYSTRAFTNQTTPNATTSGVVPGYTDLITEVRPVAASTIDVTSTLIQRYQRLRHSDFGVEHEFGPLSLDYAGLYSRTRYSIGNDDGALVNRVTSVGWTLDRTDSDLYPRFTRNGGADFSDPASYRPSPNGLTTNAGRSEANLIRDVRANARYKLPFDAFTMSLKAGGQLRHQFVSELDWRRRWTYTGATALEDDPTIVTWDEIKTGRQIPTWDFNTYLRDGEPIAPEHGVRIVTTARCRNILCPAG